MSSASYDSIELPKAYSIRSPRLAPEQPHRQIEAPARCQSVGASVTVIAWGLVDTVLAHLKSTVRRHYDPAVPWCRSVLATFALCSYAVALVPRLASIRRSPPNRSQV